MNPTKGEEVMSTKKLVVALLVFAVSMPVFGQGIKLGPQLGYQKAIDADQGKLMGGAALRAKLLPALGIEASINYRSETYADGLLKVQSWPVMVTGLYYPLPILYAAVGTGWYNTTFNYDQSKLPGIKDNTEQKVGWHFGAGVELPAGSGTTLTADIRYVFLDYHFKDLPGHGRLNNSNFYIINVGLLFGL